LRSFAKRNGDRWGSSWHKKVRELGRRASLADALSIEPIVDEAKDDDD
jgi:hypothetical protein